MRRPPEAPFLIPAFLSWSWVSPEAEAAWAPRLKVLTAELRQAATRFVAAGDLPATLEILSRAALPDRRRYLASKGLSLYPTGRPALQRSTLLSIDRVEADPEALIEGLVTRTAGVDQTLPFSNGDISGQARVLGLPNCCAGAYDSRRQHGIRDQVTLFTGGAQDATIEGPAETNPFWHRLGLRVVPHQPCALTCAASWRLGHRTLEALGDGALFEILSWPVHWSTLHGIAELKTPILRLSYASDFAPTRREVRFVGRGTAH